MGMTPNVAGLLCYLFGWVSGLIFFLVEKENKFVRFHAMQSIAVYVAFTVIVIVLWILQLITMFIPFIGILFTVLMVLTYIAMFVMWVILMIKAYQGEKFKLPWVGNFAEKQAG